MPAPEDPPPLVRVLTFCERDGEGAEPEWELEPLLRVVTTGAEGATERAPLERVRAAAEADPLDAAADPPEGDRPLAPA